MRRRHDERGAMLVFMTIGMVGILGLSGLVIDSGRAYSEHRQVQNAADAAALAGADALNSIMHTAGADESIIYQAVSASASANGTNAGFTCDLIDANRTVLSPCPATNVAGLPSGVAGVAATVRNNQATSFLKIVGITSFSAGGSAKAQVEAATFASANAPFMICGTQPNNGSPNLLLPDGAGGWMINPAAVGWTYHLHAPNVPTCNAHGSSFDGLVDTASGPFPLGGQWAVETGNRAGPVRSDLELIGGGCSGSIADGCTMVIPLCSNGGGSGTNSYLICNALGAFAVSQVAANAHDGVFLGAPTIKAGQGGGAPSAGQLRVVKLSE